MLNKIIIRNFKQFDDVEIELGNPVVFIGPNNSGKTSALQALALWDIGLKRWCEKRSGKGTAKKRTGVAINRRELVSVPVPKADHFWRNLHIREVSRQNGKPVTTNVRIEIVIQGIAADDPWECGLEFDYANDESLYCRPLRTPKGNDNNGRMPIPEKAKAVQIALLPPMSGLTANETRLDPGAINVRIGEGRTAEVLRNLCFTLSKDKSKAWQHLRAHIKSLFGVDLDLPEYIEQRGEINMTYQEKGNTLDLSSSGRGLQQTLLLLAYMYSNPGSVLLLDEPDAHLEILRQRQIYQLLTDVAMGNGNQIIAASHSEVLLNEAADRDVVVAFLGTHHRIDDRGSQVLKSLRDIGFEDYYQAQQTGWILYLEGSTDLAMLRAFARRFDMAVAQQALERPFVHYVRNQPTEVQKHYYGIREAVQELNGVALFDNLQQDLPLDPHIITLMWRYREIENYLCHEETLLAYARHTGSQDSPGELFSQVEADKRYRVMKEEIDKVIQAIEALGKEGPWNPNTKASDDFLTPLFRNYFKRLGLPNLMDKKRFYELVDFVPEDKLEDEVKEKLKAIEDTYINSKQHTE